MGKNTTIEWTATIAPDGTIYPGHTFNIVWGCQKVDLECENCYAETLAKRYGFGVWGPAKTTERRTMSDGYWQQPLAWNRSAEKAGVRAKVFCSSMADVFEDHPTVEGERLRLFDMIRRTPWLNWLLLTKRPENILPSLEFARRVGAQTASPEWNPVAEWLRDWLDGNAPANVWLGTTAGRQVSADKRIPHLLQVPAVVRFLSCEPLLGPVSLRWASWVKYERTPDLRWTQYDGVKDIHWVIAGGESGTQARPCHPKWARTLRDQCVEAGVPFFWKQWGAHIPFECAQIGTVKPHNLVGWPDNAQVMVRLNKKLTGRSLDGREWNQYPHVDRLCTF